jgi:hypothetical protein
MNQIPLPFQRALVGDKLTKQLSDGRDKFTQDLHDKVNLLTMYQYLINYDSPSINKIIWMLMILLKIKTFLWYLQLGVILTKDNLPKELE